MVQVIDESRRRLLKKCAIGIAMMPIARFEISTAFAADAALVSVNDPTAKALKYVENASKASAAKPGSKCSNCMFYQGAAGAAQGPCTVFAGKHVKAAGWCASWTAKT